MYQTFTDQLARLPDRARDRFISTWGETPWTDPKFNRPHLRAVWKKELDPLPARPRWDGCREWSPLRAALTAKNRRAAVSLLENTPFLPRREAGPCALLTLGWAPDLLEQILNRTDPRPFLWLRHQITLPTGAVVRMQGSLLMLAAALDDLPALELLLRRGDPVDYNFARDRWDLIGDMLMGGVTASVERGPVYTLQHMKEGLPAPDDTNGALPGADPLSAAIFCNAGRCALRLLQVPGVSVTPAVRRALVLTPENPTQALVAAQLDAPLEEFLQPEDFGSALDHPLFLPVLRRNPHISRQQVHSILTYYRPDPDSPLRPEHLELLSCVDPALLGDVIWEFIQSNRQRSDLFRLAGALSLPLDRCRVPNTLSRRSLADVLEHFQITGDPPEDGLSGAAAALLNQLVPDKSASVFSWREPPLTVEQLLLLPQVLPILQKESPALLTAYLEQEAVPPATALPLLSLLHIRKEVSYDL